MLFGCLMSGTILAFPFEFQSLADSKVEILNEKFRGIGSFSSGNFKTRIFLEFLKLGFWRKMFTETFPLKTIRSATNPRLPTAAMILSHYFSLNCF